MRRITNNMPAFSRAFIILALLLFSLTIAASSIKPAVASIASVKYQDASSGSVTVALEGEVTRDGHPVSTEGLQLRSGEVVVWKMVVRNRSNQTMHSVQAEGDIPQGTTFVPASTRGENVLAKYSVDGGRSYSERPNINVEGRERPAPISSYTNIQLTFSGDLKPGDVRTASYQTRLR